MNQLTQLKLEIENIATKERAIVSQRYFKTGPGEYGEGDIFIGLTVPQSRDLAKKYKKIELNEIKELLTSKIHEHRLIALFILIHKFKKSDEKEKEEIANFYLNHTRHINNWDLVDQSAHLILGEHISNKDKSILEKLAKSENLWERRISIIATLQFIRKNQFEETKRIAEFLLKDKHDLIHKAVGWMLREVGKKDKKAELEFLNKHYKTMPRTMLRYSIEHFSKEEKEHFMSK
ncbi:MAG: DNA alkylation repair protein [Candidatus Pacearchaeota archaeon]